MVDREGFVYVLAPPYSDPRPVEPLPLLGPPEAVAVGADGTVAVVDREGFVYVLAPPYSDPRPMEPFPLFGRPEAVAVGADGTVAVVDREGFVYVLAPPYSDPRPMEPFPLFGPPRPSLSVQTAPSPWSTAKASCTCSRRHIPIPVPWSAFPFSVPPRPSLSVQTAPSPWSTAKASCTCSRRHIPIPVPWSAFPLFGPPEAVAVGADGTIVVAASEGRIYRSVPPYTRWVFGILRPGYWSWIALALASVNLVLLVRILLTRRSEDRDQEDIPGIESDKPIAHPDEATTALNTLAVRIAQFVRHPDASAPMTIALTGRWGTGKSSLMRLVKRELNAHDHPCVWFNAWHHQNETHLFASLMESIRSSPAAGQSRLGVIDFYLRLLSQRPLKTILFCGSMIVLIFATIALFSALENTTSSDRSDFLTRMIGVLFFGSSGTLLWLPTTRWNPLKAFGVSPASLIRSSGTWIQFPRFRDKLSFRHNFRSAFVQVCKAFPRRRLIIIIDDLDRCHPAQVVEVLEAINFLASDDAECFVLLGIDEDQVRHAVGIRHREIAEESLTSDRGDSSTRADRPISDDVTSEIDRYKARRDYATHYLEKLINLKISVPTPDYEELAVLRETEVS